MANEYQISRGVSSYFFRLASRGNRLRFAESVTGCEILLDLRGGCVVKHNRNQKQNQGERGISYASSRTLF